MTDDDRLAVMTYVDGEMPADERTGFDARLAQEPALASAVAREQALRARLDAAYAPVLGETLPAGLLDLLAIPDPASHPAVPTLAAANDATSVGDNDAHRARLPHARRWTWPQWGAMAASLALGVLLGGRVLAPNAASSGGSAVALATSDSGTISARGALREALEQRIGGGGDKTADAVAVGLSFRNEAKQYCRTFTLAGATAGIACKQDDGWVVAHLEHKSLDPAARPTLASGSYRMAGSPFSAALMQAVDDMREGETMDANSEAAARAKGWKN
ncbi:MAG: hypothetical protein ABJD97_16140 [Betaproteobacteria bacterium]